jgi:hypothetical protein
MGDSHIPAANFLFYLNAPLAPALPLFGAGAIPKPPEMSSIVNFDRSARKNRWLEGDYT